jgi:hypothetical protein
MTIYLPDDLAEQVKNKLGDANVSGICQVALRDELERVRARAKAAEGSTERIEVWDDQRGHQVAFEGREIGREDFGTDGDVTAYLTPKGTIAVYSDIGPGHLDVYDEFAAFAEDVQENWRGGRDLLAQAAGALGEKYVEELDI